MVLVGLYGAKGSARIARHIGFVQKRDAQTRNPIPYGVWTETRWRHCWRNHCRNNRDHVTLLSRQWAQMSTNQLVLSLTLTPVGQCLAWWGVSTQFSPRLITNAQARKDLHEPLV